MRSVMSNERTAIKYESQITDVNQNKIAMICPKPSDSRVIGIHNAFIHGPG